MRIHTAINRNNSTCCSYAVQRELVGYCVVCFLMALLFWALPIALRHALPAVKLPQRDVLHLQYMTLEQAWRLDKKTSQKTGMNLAAHAHASVRLQDLQPVLSYLAPSLQVSWMKFRLSSRRHYGNMDAEAAAPGLDLQQPPAVFADGNVVAANGVNMAFDNNINPVVFAARRPSCMSRCCSICGVISCVALTALFAILASFFGGLLFFSSGLLTFSLLKLACFSH